MQVHHVTYKGDIDNPNEFYKDPWLMNVPESLQEECYDVIVVE